MTQRRSGSKSRASDDAVGRAGAGQQPPPFEPHRALGHAQHQAEHHHRGQHACPHHDAPRPLGTVADQRVAQLIDQRRQQEAQRVAALQEPRRDATMFGRPLFEGQRHARGPHAAHAETEQPAEREQHDVGGRTAAQERKARVPGDRKQDRALPSVAIRENARADAAEHPEEQGDRPEQAGQGPVDLEALLDVEQDERQDGEIKGVERPGRESGEKGLPLLPGDFPVPRLRHARPF